jgi:predicted ATP-dependent serine protease
MGLWECAECTAKYAVGLPKCPQCESTVRVNEATQPAEEDTDMAKVTVHGGASNAAADEPEEGEDVSAGTSSSTSSEKEPNSPEQSETQAPSRARGAGNRSKRAHAEQVDGTADSTATSGRKTAGPDSDEPSK